jgi:hypothetical protein
MPSPAGIIEPLNSVPGNIGVYEDWIKKSSEK